MLGVPPRWLWPCCFDAAAVATKLLSDARRFDAIIGGGGGNDCFGGTFIAYTRYYLFAIASNITFTY
jgi:hypothetical protein